MTRKKDSIAEQDRGINELKELVKAAGSIAKYAEIVGVSRKTVHGMMSGETRISDKVLVRPSHCVMCQKPMTHGTTDCGAFVPVCIEPDCPKHGLLQVGIEHMREIWGAE